MIVKGFFSSSSGNSANDVFNWSFVILSLSNFGLSRLKRSAFNVRFAVRRCVFRLLDDRCVVTVLLWLSKGCFEFTKSVFRWVWSSWLFNERAVEGHLLNTRLFRKKLRWLVEEYTFRSYTFRRTRVFFLVIICIRTICLLARITQKLRFTWNFSDRFS